MLGIPLAAVLALAPASLLLAPAEPAPTDVTVAWTSPAHTDVVVTWTETGDLRDRIDLVNPDGSPTGWASKYVEIGQPNRSSLPGTSPGDDARIVVTAVDADDNPISEPGSSPVFDMDTPPQPVMKSVAPHEDGTVDMTWAAGTATDDTPGDPLDYDGETRFIPIAADSGFNQYSDLAEASAATSFTVPASQKYPTSVGVRTEPTFWGYSGAAIAVTGTKVTASIPRAATTGAKLKVTGTVVQVVRFCDPGPCGHNDEPDAGRVLTLQARTDAGAAWATVATTKATSKGAFAFSITFPGARDYRVIAAPVAFPARSSANMYAETPATTTRAAADGGSGGSDGPGLPITGAPIIWIAVAGGALVLAGIGFAVAGRRRF